MAITAITAPPFTLDHPYIQLGPTATGVEISCAGTNLKAEPNQDSNTTKTFCGNYTTFADPDWTITVTIAQSYGTGGSWTVLQPLMGTTVPFEIRPDQATASVDNPVMSGTCYVAWMSFVDAAPGEISEVDLVLTVQGQPAWGITSPTSAQAASAAA